MGKIIGINTVSNNSTGRIMHDTLFGAKERGYDVLLLVGRRKAYRDLPSAKYGSLVSFAFHVLVTFIFDLHGYASFIPTKRLIYRIKREKPEILHLHNIHGYYVNVPMLFDFINNEFDGSVIWTLHDLWPITGHCAYYTAAKCEKWRDLCYKCPNKKKYPVSLLIDNSKYNYKRKKDMFSKNKKMTLVVPSRWMKEQIDGSFLFGHKVEIINNGVDVHKYTIEPEIVAYISKYNISNEVNVILGVANIWEERKGLYDFIKLAAVIPEQYVIVLIGLSKKQISSMPNNIIGIEKTDDYRELVAWYNRAQVFVNPSKEESFSLVTVEAQLCGTPCIVVDNTAVADLVNETNGIVLHEPTEFDYISAIHVIEDRRLNKNKIRESALLYSNEVMIDNYNNLYEALLNK